MATEKITKSRNKYLTNLLSRSIFFYFLFLFASSLHAYIPDEPDRMKVSTALKGKKVRYTFESQIRPHLLAEISTGISTDSGPYAQRASAADELEEDADFADGLEDEFAEQTEEDVFDPLSGYNRVMTQVNDKLYFWVLKPVAKGYQKVVPTGARRAVVRFFNNLLFPVRFVNNSLQLKFRQAGIELGRFCVNTTAGVLGFGDPAKRWFGWEAQPEDFGQTLGHYGVGGGFHVVLPLLGPSNLRDMAGLIPDYILDPVSQVEGDSSELAVRSYERINHTSLHIGEYESLKKDAVDLYPFLRDTYEQNRKKKIEE